MTIKPLKETLLHEGWVRLQHVEFETPPLAPARKAGRLQREVMICNDAVVVLVHAPDIDSFLFTREYRAGVICNPGRDNPLMYQNVAGQIDKGKSPRETACEEMMEEAGITYRPEDLAPVASVYASPGCMTEKVHLFLARVPGTPATGLFGVAEEGEVIRTELVTRPETYRMMDEGAINDAMTFLSLSWFRARHG